MKCELLQLAAAVVAVNSCSNIKVDKLEFMGTSIFFNLKTQSTVLINLVTTKTFKLKPFKEVSEAGKISSVHNQQNHIAKYCMEMSALRCLQTFCANKIFFF